MPKRRLLKPIIDRDSYHKPIQDEIEYYFYDLLYRPLLELLKDETGLTGIKVNSPSSSVIKALQDGKIQYVDGFFVGQLNANLSKYFRSIGGTFNHVKKGWKVSLPQMPSDLKVAMIDNRAKSRELIARLQTKIDEIQHAGDLITRPVNPKPQVGKIVEGLQKQYEETVPVNLAIEPDINPYVYTKIEDEYTKNLNKYIKDWEEEAIFRLRDQVEQNAFMGFRADKMVDRIMAESGVSQRKAEFLARQETSLLVSKYRQAKYEDSGIATYQWSTSHDVRVRDRHKELDGRIFRFDDPPITDPATGARNNPGEDFNCRCVAIPIFNEAWESVVK